MKTLYASTENMKDLLKYIRSTKRLTGRAQDTTKKQSTNAKHTPTSVNAARTLDNQMKQTPPNLEVQQMDDYSVRKSKMQKKMHINSSEWYEKAVMELDSALNKWADSVPTHLRWDTPHISEIFFTQSAILYTMYYWVQIQIHRRFIPRPGQKSEVSLPSLTICTNAARSCIKVCNTYCQRKISPFGEFIIVPLFNSAMILTVNLWKSTQTNITANALATSNSSRDLAEIYKCIELIRIYEPKDVINTVISASHYPLMTSSSVHSSDRAGTSNAGIPPSFIQPFQNSVETQDAAGSFHLPLYTNELGSFSLSSDTTSFDSASVAGKTGQVEYDKLFDLEFSTLQSQMTPTLDNMNSEGNFQFGNAQPSYQDNGASSHLHFFGATSSSDASKTDTDMLWPGDPSYAQDWDTFMASVEAMIQNQDQSQISI
ncbi:hypothetical protein K435DRAFT_845840 [Dendrothele bispora CBS 962.96]|uniref:Transcription factor domain-containing protein n=1 Tax=Dendrothele bispora (strain CBS 962.96) TaxID=1314807 RepID=A0A4S8KR96_DENBC|nr:hypothetical protein K435DRAFT_845840 [Dendrothele bispora CBS 962.96]